MKYADLTVLNLMRLACWSPKHARLELLEHPLEPLVLTVRAYKAQVFVRGEIGDDTINRLFTTKQTNLMTPL